MISILWLVPHSAMMPCQLIAWFIHVVWCFRYLTFLAVLHQPVQWLVQSLEWTCVRLTMELFCFFNCLHVWTCVSECVWMDLNFIGSLVSECVWMDLNFIGSMVSEWFLNVFLNVNRLSPAGQTILVGRVKRKI